MCYFNFILEWLILHNLQISTQISIDLLLLLKRIQNLLNMSRKLNVGLYPTLFLNKYSNLDYLKYIKSISKHQSNLFIGNKMIRYHANIFLMEDFRWNAYIFINKKSSLKIVYLRVYIILKIRIQNNYWDLSE